MIKDKNIFSSFTPKNRDLVSYGDNKGKIVGTATIVRFIILHVEPCFTGHRTCF